MTSLIEVGHAQKRVDDLEQFLPDILVENKFDLKTCERLRGNLSLLESHFYGRGPAQALRTLEMASRSGVTSLSVTALCEACHSAIA